MTTTATAPRTKRVIRDIDTLDQAIKAEQDVESGFHRVIEENVHYWTAVEEDIIESYTKLIQRAERNEVKNTFERIVEDSKKHKRLLTEIITMLNEIVSDEVKHVEILTNLRKHLQQKNT